MSDTPEQPDFGPRPNKAVPPPPTKPKQEVKLTPPNPPAKDPANQAPSKPDTPSKPVSPGSPSKPVSITPAATEAKKPTPTPAPSRKVNVADKDQGVSTVGFLIDVIAALVAIAFTVLIFLDVKPFL